MSIASQMCADCVNKRGARAITEMEDLKIPTYSFKPNGADAFNKAIDQCIEIVKKKFTGWTE